MQSVIMQVVSKLDDCAAGVQFLITSMITGRIGQHKVLLPFNHNITIHSFENISPVKTLSKVRNSPIL